MNNFIFNCLGIEELDELGADTGWLYVFESAKGDAGWTTGRGNAREKPDSHALARHIKGYGCLQYFSEATLTQGQSEISHF